MEKLIELLNEYVKQLWIWDYVWWHNEETVRNSDYFLTKKFWFIQRLVENDKIDKQKVKEKSEFLHIYTIPNPEKYYKSLIMELSIQDNPIEFLISILK